MLLYVLLFFEYKSVSIFGSVLLEFFCYRVAYGQYRVAGADKKKSHKRVLNRLWRCGGRKMILNSIGRYAFMHSTMI